VPLTRTFAVKVMVEVMGLRTHDFYVANVTAFATNIQVTALQSPHVPSDSLRFLDDKVT